MGLLVSDVPIGEDESVRYRGSAGVFRKRRLVGGQLVVTDRRFVFVPNRMDSLFGAPPVVFDLAEIDQVEMAPAGGPAGIARGAAAARQQQVDVHRRGGELVVVIVKEPEPLLELLRP